MNRETNWEISKVEVPAGMRSAVLNAVLKARLKCWPSGQLVPPEAIEEILATALEWAEANPTEPWAFLQWKGTSVCMDCACTCGEQFHVDPAFACAVKCPHCGRRYAMATKIGMREIAPDEPSEL